MKNMDDKIRLALAVTIAAGLFVFALGFHFSSGENSPPETVCTGSGEMFVLPDIAVTGSIFYSTPEEEKIKYIICSQDDCHFTKEYAKPDNNCVAFFDFANKWYELCGTYSIEEI